MQRACLVLVLCVAGLLAGCAAVKSTFTTSPGSSASGTPSVSVTIFPATVGVVHDGTLSFSASVSGSNNVNLTWSVKEGASAGTIDSNGTYTAPATLGVFHIVATSQADPSKSAAASVTVTSSGFTTIGGLNYARLQQTATLLPSGKVLIAGGGVGPDTIDGYSVVDQAELFDPATKTFNVAGLIARDSHTATLLQSGDVLLVGGESGWDPHGNAYGNPSPIVVDTAEIVQVASGLSSVPTGNMLVARESHAASLLSDGRVLITGGEYDIPVNPFWGELTESEVFDPVTGKFTAVGQMTTARAFHTSTLLQNGKVLITGGEYPVFSNTAELFDPATDTFRLTGNMAVQRGFHTATLLPNGKVLIIGNSALAELYDPSTERFSPAGTMNFSRVWHTATLLPNGTVLIAGGSTDNGSTKTTEIYDPDTGLFTMGPSMQQDRMLHTATLLANGDVLIAGGAASDGIDITVLASAEVFH